MNQAAVAQDVYDLFDGNDQYVTQGTYETAAAKSLFTRSVHILIIDEDGKILLCRRALTKRSYPGTYTSSAGGHVEIGEDHEQGAHRELQEELSIEVELTDYGRFDVVNETERTIHHLFVAFPTSEELAQITFDSTEVDEHRYWSVPEIQDALSTDSSIFAKPFLEAFKCFVLARQIVLDFDHTLFDWYRFKSDLQKSLEEQHATSAELFSKAKDRSEEKAGGMYHIHDHLRELAELTGKEAKELHRTLDALLRHGERYIYPDALTFLEKARTDEHNILTLVTYGHEENQAIFIMGTEAHKYFDKIICVATKAEKSAWFKRLTHISIPVPYVINDDPGEGQQVFTHLAPHTRHILIERPTAKYTTIPAHDGYSICQDLGEISIG
jgi:isopentenyldiphosphate isomerase